MRTYVYIDGFNLYYGALKGTPYKWLDVKKLIQNILAENHQIDKIKFFTARVKPTVNDPKSHLRQQVYLRALEAAIPEIEIVYGHFLQHPISLPICTATGEVILKNDRPKFVTVCKREEKGSDVNLAVHFLNDAWQNKYDCGVIVSNDSDLAEALKLVKNMGNIKLGVISPFDNMSKELRAHSTFQRKINTGALQDSQLPTEISGTNIKKPNNW